jgi:hypothetical protein
MSTKKGVGKMENQASKGNRGRRAVLKAVAAVGIVQIASPFIVKARGNSVRIYRSNLLYDNTSRADSTDRRNELV